MIPIQLTLQGVYSYQEKQIIDFQSLTSAGLFGIFGKVGSGKSSIIEAITYVLYGESQRLGKSGFAYNITNLRSNNLEIDYVFTIANEQFRFKASGKRQKQFNSVKIERFAWKWDNDKNDWLPIQPEAEAVLGLKYGDFRRTVIIPQGNFQEFLELSKVDRSTMMQTLFGLEKFDLSENTKALKEQNDMKINTLETKIAELGGLSSDAIVELEQNQTVISSQIQLLEVELKNAIDTDSTLRQLLNDLKDAEIKQQRLAQLQANIPNIEQKKLQLKNYRDVFTYFKPVYDNTLSLKKEISDAQNELESEHKKHLGIKSKLEKLKEQEQALNVAFLQRDVLKNQAEELNTIAKIVNLNKSLIGFNKDKTEQGNIAKKMQLQLQNEKDRIHILQEEKLNIKKQNIDIQTITNLLLWYGQYENLIKEKNELWNKANEEHEKEKNIIAQKSNFKSSFLTEIDENTELDLINTKINEAIASLKTNIEENEQQKIILSQRVALLNHAHTLIDGEPCPLCGAAHHPNKLTDNEDWGALLEQNQRQKNDFQKAEKQLLQQQIEITKLITQLQNIENEKTKIKIRFEEKKKSILEQEHKFIWASFDLNDKTKAIEAKNIYENQAKSLENIETQLQKTLQNIEHIEQQLRNEIEPNLKEIEFKTQALSTEISILSQQLNLLKMADYQNYTETEIQNIVNDLINKFENIGKDFETIKANVQNEQSKETSQAAKINQLNIAFERLLQKNEQLKLGLNDALNNLKITDIAIAEKILAQQLNIQKEDQIIESFGKELSVAEHEYQLANEKIFNKHFEQQQYDDNLLLIKSLKNQIAVATENLGSVKKQITQAKANLERQKDLQKDLDKATLRRENLAILEGLFRGQGFVNYASKVYLQNLIGIANERFLKMTQRQLKLQLTNDNDFEVLDLLNGGRNRSVRTLSGGQKFQASLCLALALTDSISGAHRENFFFLDEGFGALDKNALQVVFETLQSLRKENRVIGIISHVEDMQQEIENYIKVELDDEKGSIVEVV